MSNNVNNLFNNRKLFAHRPVDPGLPKLLRRTSVVGGRPTATCALFVALGLGCNHSYGETGSATSDTSSLQEINVTANRVGTERLQDVPMSISAISAERLSEIGANSMADFLRGVPGVSLNEQQPGVNRIVMRGIVSGGYSPTSLQDRSLVAVYLDDIPITLNTSNPDIRSVDLERVEVIRGPQGTLYGSGSMAGTVRFISKKPNPNAFSGSTEGQVSSTDGGGTNYNVRGSVNLPLVSESLGLRVSGFRESNSGFVDNVGLGAKRVNSSKTTQAHIALRFIANDRFTLDASILHEQLRSNGRSAVYPILGDDVYTSQTPEGFDDRTNIYNITAEYRTDWATLTSSSSYVQREFENRQSFEYLTGSVLGIYLPSPNFSHNTVKKFTQELRAISRPGRLTWQVGAFYERDHRLYVENDFTQGLDALIGAPATVFSAPYADEIYYARIDTLDKQWAVFGEAVYEIAPKFTATIGLRYFRFKGPVDLFQGGIAGVDPLGLPLSAKSEEDSSGTNPRFVLNYKFTDDLMVFAEAAKGFRYGGANYPVPVSLCAAQLAEVGLTSAPLTFGSDSLWSYSIGEKGSFFDRRLSVNATAFLIDWQDTQVTRALTCGYPYKVNTGQVRSTGFEFEGRFWVIPAVELGLTASYTDAKASRAIPEISARDGDPVPFFPKWITSITADVTVPMASNKVLFSADYTHQSETASDFNSTSPIYRVIPALNTLNAAVNYVAGSWQLGIYGRNLTNNKLVNSVGPPLYAGTPGEIEFIGRPKTVGLRLQYSF